jgi:hypothetical protein
MRGDRRGGRASKEAAWAIGVLALWLILEPLAIDELAPCYSPWANLIVALLLSVTLAYALDCEDSNAA